MDILPRTFSKLDMANEKTDGRVSQFEVKVQHELVLLFVIQFSLFIYKIDLKIKIVCHLKDLPLFNLI